MKKKEKKFNKLDKYIILCVILIVVYTIVHTIIFAITGLEAKILDVLFYTTFGLEMLYCFLIKRFNLHEEAKIIFSNKRNEGEEILNDYEGMNE